MFPFDRMNPNNMWHKDQDYYVPVVSMVGAGPKGEKGDKGDKGDRGTTASFGEVVATVDNNVGTPYVDVETSGPSTSRNVLFKFHNLKGDATDAIQTANQALVKANSSIRAANTVVEKALAALAVTEAIIGRTWPLMTKYTRGGAKLGDDLYLTQTEELNVNAFTEQDVISVILGPEPYNPVDVDTYIITNDEIASITGVTPN